MCASVLLAVLRKRRNCARLFLYTTTVSTKEEGLQGRLRFENARAFPLLPSPTLNFGFFCL